MFDIIELVTDLCDSSPKCLSILIEPSTLCTDSRSYSAISVLFSVS